MANAGTMKIVISADARPAIESVSDARDLIAIHTAATVHERNVVYERLYRRHLRTAAGVFDGVAQRRHPLDPRQLIDRWHARALRRWVARSEAAAPTTEEQS